MEMQWSKDKNSLIIDSIKGLKLTKFSFSGMLCKDFHLYLSKNPDLLRKIASVEKYKRTQINAKKKVH